MRKFPSYRRRRSDDRALFYAVETLRGYGLEVTAPINPKTGRRRIIVKRPNTKENT